MDVVEVYHFLFETVPGIGVLVAIGLGLSIVLSAIFEVRIRKRYRFRNTAPDGAPEEDWETFKEEVVAAELAEEEKLAEAKADK